MSLQKAWVRIECVVEMPDDDLKADDAFQEFTDHIEALLNSEECTPTHMVYGSLSIGDADTAGEA